MTGQSTNGNENFKQAFNEREIKETLDLLILNGKKLSDDLKVTLKKKINNLTEQKQLQDLFMTIKYYRTEKTKIQNSLNDIKEKTTKKERRNFNDKKSIVEVLIQQIEKLCNKYKHESQMKFGLKHLGKTRNYKVTGQSLFKDDELMEITKTTPEVDRAFKEINDMRKEIEEQKRTNFGKNKRKKISERDRQSWYIMEDTKRKLDSTHGIIINYECRIKWLKIEIKEKRILNDYIHQRYENIIASFHKAMNDENRKNEIITNQLKLTLKNKSMLRLQILSNVKRVEPIEFYNETKKRYLHNLHAELCRRIKKVDPIDQMDNQNDDHIEFKERKRKKKEKRNKEEKNKLKNLFLEIIITNSIKLEEITKIDEALVEHRNKILADRFHLFEFSPHRE